MAKNSAEPRKNSELFFEFKKNSTVQVRLYSFEGSLAERLDEVWRIQVRDSGVGVPQDAIGRLFTPFVQADESTTRQFGGTGLGLSIVRNLARMMGGDAEVSSTVGVGSEFSITLPLLKADEHAVAKAVRASRPIQVAMLCADEDLWQDMRRRLYALGWVCFRPLAGESGEPDVVLMDAALGVQGAEKLRDVVKARLGQGLELPAIVMGDVQELASADEVFVTGTMGGVTPAGSIDGHALKSARGPVTTTIAQAYERLKDTYAREHAAQ